ncbi:MAG: hypothetical protein BRD50_01760 [Bacteroidetes bacterium SW_11_45_7]|nr:MAG: hypothetical protein BRD50_01760 [Bacteroidetes bacterium SW_11_45_7]
MKHYQSAWRQPGMLALLAVMILPSCTEKGPDIQLTNERRAFKDSTYVASEIEAPQQKRVVLEEFTGVGCPNCPEADTLIDNFLKKYENLIVLGYHDSSSYFTLPYGNERDLRTDEAKALNNLLSPFTGRPAASIDRKQFSGESNLVLGTGKWANYISQRTQSSTPVNMSLSTRYEDSTRSLSVEVRVHYTSPENQLNRLTIAIIENDIITKQALGGGEYDTNYTQKHVLVGTLTNAKGTSLNENLEQGRTIIESYRKELPKEWVADNCKVVAFVARSGSSKTILQGTKESVE